MELGMLRLGDMFECNGNIYKAEKCIGDNIVICVNQKNKKACKFSVFAEVEKVTK